MVVPCLFSRIRSDARETTAQLPRTKQEERGGGEVPELSSRNGGGIPSAIRM